MVQGRASADSARHADLAELVLRAARELTFREHPDAVRLAPAVSNVMRYIDHHPGSAPSEVAKAVGLSRSNLSAALRELERIGFVERRGHPTDRRAANLFSTEVAARNLEAIRADWAVWVEEAFGDADPGHEDAVVGVLDTLADGLTRARLAGGTSK